PLISNTQRSFQLIPKAHPAGAGLDLNNNGPNTNSGQVGNAANITAGVITPTSLGYNNWGGELPATIVGRGTLSETASISNQPGPKNYIGLKQIQPSQSDSGIIVFAGGGGLIPLLNIGRESGLGIVLVDKNRRVNGIEMTLRYNKNVIK